MEGAGRQRHVFIHTAGIAVVFYALLSIGPVLTMTGSAAMAQATGIPGNPAAGLLRGAVTEVGRDHISIDSIRYDLRPDVIIQDERSQPRELKEIEIGGFVAYHIKYGRIDQLVLVLPR